MNNLNMVNFVIVKHLCVIFYYYTYIKKGQLNQYTFINTHTTTKYDKDVAQYIKCTSIWFIASWSSSNSSASSSTATAQHACNHIKSILHVVSSTPSTTSTSSRHVLPFRYHCDLSSLKETFI